MERSVERRNTAWYVTDWATVRLRTVLVKSSMYDDIVPGLIILKCGVGS